MAIILKTTNPMLFGEDVRLCKFSCTAGEGEAGECSLEQWLWGNHLSLSAKHQALKTWWVGGFTSKQVPKEMHACTCTPRDSDKNSHRSVLPNSLKLEITQMSLKIKQIKIVVCSSMAYNIVLKMNKLSRSKWFPIKDRQRRVLLYFL